ncbi:hypothetical protein CR105_07295 [Massilia eurypsychrophila]|uniref:DUF2141 domain-containing protein n=1 Tax=Massilia eurypsychrophila TaxID=1485217 RepID=A0A2G8TIJ8_9BURK|nr:DUF2141 domain-containing protein [Massilia eurypsychrophila]PIL45853.1 hypothetical protein CR105_07295 [Massilia eurypsychrophila]
MTPLGTLSFCAALLAAAPAGAADLTIHVDDVKAAGGTIQVALYNSADTFMKTVAGLGKTAATGQANMVVFKDLPAGEYAFALFHDANSNEKLDKFGIPTEDYAFSNNALGKMGPPTYDSARFTLPAAGATVRVSLR